MPSELGCKTPNTEQQKDENDRFESVLSTLSKTPRLNKPFWVETSWKLPTQAREQIAERLRIDDAREREVLSSIQRVLQGYRSWLMSAKDEPPLKELTELHSVRDGARSLLDSLSQLGPDARELLDEQYYNTAFEGLAPHVHLTDVRPTIARLARAAEIPLGRPRKDPEAFLIQNLAWIWQRAHDKQAARVWDEYKGKEGGPFYEFVQACLEAVNPDEAVHLPTGVIRRVLEAMDKRLSPSEDLPKDL